MSRITEVEIIDFEFDAPNLERTGLGQLVTFKRGSKVRATKYAVVIKTDNGLRGEYVTTLGGDRRPLLGETTDAGALPPRARSPIEREGIYDDLKREARQFDHMGHGPLDIALWDLAGKKLRRLGERAARRLPQAPAGLCQHLSSATRTAASTARRPSPPSPKQCYGLGYRAFKIHGWNDGDARRRPRTCCTSRKAVGDRMDLMLDPACQLRTFADALYVGRACDEAQLLLVRGPVPRRRHVGLRAQEAARDDQDAAAA